MKKLELTAFIGFQVVTEVIVVFFMALGLRPQHVLLKIQILGTEIILEVKELFGLPTSFVVGFVIALIIIFIYVLIFSFSRFSQWK